MNTSCEMSSPLRAPVNVCALAHTQCFMYGDNRGTLLIKNSHPLRPYRRPTPRALRPTFVPALAKIPFRNCLVDSNVTGGVFRDVYRPGWRDGACAHTLSSICGIFKRGLDLRVWGVCACAHTLCCIYGGSGFGFRGWGLEFLA